jgi:hypothetical protein
MNVNKDDIPARVFTLCRGTSTSKHGVKKVELCRDILFELPKRSLEQYNCRKFVRPEARFRVVMSMLAEPRRRQKWTLNPRGNLWANDESKFGQKLMEKMGWEKGKVSRRERTGKIKAVKKGK